MKGLGPLGVPLACLLTTVAPLPVMSQTVASIDGQPIPELPATVSRGAGGNIVVRAVRLEQPPVLDGALDEDVYSTILPAAGFVQQYPWNGEPATEDTQGVAFVKCIIPNFSVVRIKSDVLRRSNVGLIMTNRNPSLPGGKSNLVYGADANMLFYENMQINAFYARSSTTETGGDADSYRAQVQYDSDRYGIQGEVLKVGDAFNPEVGFLLRDDFRRTFASARFSPRPAPNRYFRRLIWEARIDRFVNGAEILETQKATGIFNEFNSSDVLSFEFSRNLEFLTEPFEVAGDLVVSTGRYRFNEAFAGLQLGAHRKVSGTLNLSRGDFFDGHRTGIGYFGRVEFTSRFAVEPRISFDWISLPSGKTPSRSSVSGRY